MLRKTLTAFIALALWCVSFCMPPAQAQACCQDTHTRMDAAMSCCMAQAIVIQDAHRAAGFGSTDAAPAAVVLPCFEKESLSQEAVLLANAHVADQSGRYLELRVLLN